jgi:GNAT superfamily N-acetyltransferase
VVTIRDALVPDELAVVRELFREYADGLGVDLCFQGFNEELATLPGQYVRPAGGLWLAVDDANVLGCVALRALDAQRCEIKRMYVRESARGLGAGRLLAEHVMRAAREAGYGQMYLDTLPKLHAAIALYRSLGFRQTEPYCHNPLPGVLFFACDLAQPR